MSKSVCRTMFVTIIMVLTLLFLFQTVAGYSSHTVNAYSKIIIKKQVAPQESGIDRLLADSNGSAVITQDDVTHVVNFARIPAGSLDLPAASNASPEEKARLFFDQYADAFGIQDVNNELLHLSTRTDAAGGSHVSFQQVYQGVPVFAAILRVHFDSSGEVTAVNGTFLPKIALNTTPQINANAAADIAVNAVGASNLIIAKNDLQIFRTGLAQGISGSDYLVYEVEVTDRSNIREFFFIDAYTGDIVERINGIQDALFRRVYDGGYGPSFITWEEGDGFPTGNTDINNIISGSGESYDLFFNAFGFDAYDGAGSDMEAVNDDPNINCPNANWNGVSTNYCTGVTGDDTVAHEWGHAYTEYTHNLIYQWQPGALNEAYSDIWGEVVDFINNRGTDTPGGLRTAGSCSIYGNGSPSVDDTYRWLSGEDDPAFGGAIRDLWNPVCYGDPGKVSDTAYHCLGTDGGGVHTNSGVPNHAFALLVDGGTYNSVTVSGIGLTKAAHIYWQAQSVYQTPTTDFADHADALEASCTDLIGVNLNDLSTGSPSGEMISAADCTELGNALDAVEMRDEPLQCNFQPMLDPNPPPLCGGQVTTIFTDTLESDPTSTWTISHMDVYSTTNLNWEWVSSLPDGRPGSAFYGVDPQIGSCSEGPGDVSGVMHTDSPTITIPVDALVPRLSYIHWIASEAGWDGGNLKISVNSGPWQVVADADYTFNSYNTTLNSAGAGNTNPLAGEPGFSGTDGGEISGSWYESQVDLSSYAGPNDVIQLRFDFGMDGCTGLVGWYVDDVHVYSCSEPMISVDQASVSSSQLPDTVMTKTLTINNDGSTNLDWTIFEDGTSAVSIAPNKNIASDTAIERLNSAAPAAPSVSTPALDANGGIVSDGSFEAGSPNPFWNEASTNFGTPLCDPASCGPALAHTGSWYVWFGGTSATETGSVDQDVTIPSGTADLTFWLVMGDSGGTGFMSVDIDNTVVFSVTEADVGSYGAYTEVTIDVSAFADGGSHNLQFLSTTTGGTFNFFVDDVDITSTNPNTICDAPADIPWLSVSPTTGTIGPSSSTPVDLVFDSTGVANGVYSGTVCIDSNDLATPQIAVPVSMTIMASFPPEIVVDPSSLSANLAADNVTTHTLSIGNLGTEDLDWTIFEDGTTQAPAILPDEGVSNSPERQIPKSPAVPSASVSSPTSSGGVVADGGFEAGTPNPSWNEFSANFGTPLCNAGCGTGGGTGPHSGSWWAWFGGVNASETGFVDQNVTIPVGFDSLSFWLEIPVADNTGFLNVEIDDTIVFSVTEADAGTYATYAEVVLDISAYADGGSHKLEFYSEVSPGSNVTNFFVDDVAIAAAMAAACDAPADIPWLSVSPTSGTTVSGTSSLIDVTFDATGLSPSVYTGTLCIESNDAMTPLVTLPVMLTVDASISYGVSVAPDAAMTGEVGTAVSYMLEVMNTGNTADTFDLAVTGNNWNTTLSESSVSLNAGNSATIMVTVNIPAIATDGAMDTVTVTATSQGDGAVSDSATLTTTAVVTGPPTMYLPVFIKD